MISNISECTYTNEKVQVFDSRQDLQTITQLHVCIITSLCPKNDLQNKHFLLQKMHYSQKKLFN